MLAVNIHCQLNISDEMNDETENNEIISDPVMIEFLPSYITAELWQSSVTTEHSSSSHQFDQSETSIHY